METLATFLKVFFVYILSVNINGNVDTQDLFQLMTSKFDAFDSEVRILRMTLLSTIQELQDKVEKLEIDVQIDSKDEKSSPRPTKDIVTLVKQALHEEKTYTRNVIQTIETVVDNNSADVDVLRATLTEESTKRQELNMSLTRHSTNTRDTIKSLTDNVNRNNERLVQLKESIDLIQREQASDKHSLGDLKDIASTLKTDLVQANLKLTNHISGHTALVQNQIDSNQGCQGGSFGASGWPSAPSFPFEKTVHFSPSFSSPPQIILGMNTLDVQGGFRVQTTVTEVTNTYFKVRINRWASTTIYSVYLNWMACPK